MSKTLFIGCSHTMGYSGFIVAEDKNLMYGAKIITQKFIVNNLIKT